MSNFFKFVLLAPFTGLYLLIVFIRNILYDRKIYRSVEFDLPIINVGNLSAGGSGKSPMVEYLIRLLSDKYKVAVLSRGYGRRSKGFHEVFVNQTALFSGDEPLLFKRGFGDLIRVFVGENRVEAITQIMFQYPDTEVILLDDAFQHRSLKAGFNLLLTDFSKPFWLDTLLPSGRLREPKEGAFRADAIILTKVPDDAHPQQIESFEKAARKYEKPVFSSKLCYGDITTIDGKLTETANKKFFLVTAIANPAPLEKFVASNFSLVGKWHFHDHHHFLPSEIRLLNEKIANFADPSVEVLTTTKDAVRFAGLIEKGEKIGFKINVIPVVPQFVGDDRNIFNKMIIDYVRESSANSRVLTDED